MPMVHVGEEGAKEQADQILDDFVAACADLNVRYCLIAGTALGFYRDGGYIENDNDIDAWIDIEADEHEGAKFDLASDVGKANVRVKVLTPFFGKIEGRHFREGEIITIYRARATEMEARGLIGDLSAPPRSIRPMGTGKKFKALVKRLKELGFYCGPHFHHFARGNMLLDLLGGIRKPHRYDPAHYESFDTVIYNGKEYNVPGPIEDYLKSRYGGKWKTPRIRKPRK